MDGELNLLESPLTYAVLALLSRDELKDILVSCGVSVSNYAWRSKPRLIQLIQGAGDTVEDNAVEAVSRRIAANLERRESVRVRRAEQQRAGRRRDRQHGREAHEADRLGSISEPPLGDPTRFLELPSDEQTKKCYKDYITATSAESLAEEICAVCAQLLNVIRDGVKTVLLSELPNTHRLKPRTPHHSHDLVSGLLLERGACYQHESGAVELKTCRTCRSSLKGKKDNPPMLSLANSMWLGPVPFPLQILTLPEQILIARLYPRVYIVKLFPKDRRGGFDFQTLQSALKGNVTTFELNTPRVAAMVEGQLMPPPASTLAKVLSVTYVGPGPLPKNWLKATFRVRRQCVRAALVWLKQHNRYFSDIVLDEDRLVGLPEDDVPEEILVTTRQEDDVSIIDMENDTYVPDGGGPDSDVVEHGDDDVGEPTSNEDFPEDADVIPLQYMGVMDTDQSNLSPTELMAWGLANMWTEGREGGYVVRHSGQPAQDFGISRRDLEAMRGVRREESHGEGNQAEDGADPIVDNYWEKAFPTLFPYGTGGPEGVREVFVPLDSHVQWLLRYHDRRFRHHGTFAFTACSIKQRRQALSSARVQLQRQDAASIARELSQLKVSDLIEASHEEEQGRPHSNPAVRVLKKHLHASSSHVLGSDASRIRLRSQIWSTCIALGLPSLWLTINPDDLHDPIAQVFAGEDINIDDLLERLAPVKEKRAQNIARDPYAAAQFFHFLIDTVLETLIGLKPLPFGRLRVKEGIFGFANAYFGVVECQGRGTLHFHLLVWLKNTPSAETMKTLLRTEEFRSRVSRFIYAHFRSHLDSLGSTAEDISRIAAEPEVAYSRPPDPSDADFARKAAELELAVIRTKQIHTCGRGCWKTFRTTDGVSKRKCKRRAPWPLSETDSINEAGVWSSRRSYGYLNTYVPSISIMCRCNNDGKLLTNTADTNNITFYVAGYAAKKQGKTYNSSALLAKGLAFHFKDSVYRESLRDNARMLLFRSINVLNRQQELPAPMVHSYLMGWGDTKKSHHYSVIFWTSFVASLLRTFPALRRQPVPAVHHTIAMPEGEPVMSEMETETRNPRDANEPSAETSERVEVQADEDGRLVTRTQVIDYQFRGAALSNYSVLAFFMNTYESPKPKNSRAGADEHVQNDGVEQDEDFPSSEAAGTSTRSIRVEYLEGHPKAQSVLRIIRQEGHNTLPDFIGYHALPRKGDSDTADFYYAAMLVLLKPWRVLDDLLSGVESWEEAFEGFVATASPWTLTVIQNIEHVHSCKSAAEEGRGDEGVEEIGGTVNREHDDEPMDIDDDFHAEAGREITEEMIEQARAEQTRTSDVVHGQVAVQIGKSAGVFQSVSTAWRPKARLAIGDDLERVGGWRDAMARQVAGRDLETVGEAVGVGGEADVHRLEDDTFAQPDMAHSDVTRIEAEAAIAPVDVDRLRADQRRAFEIIDWHLGETLAGREVPQLLMQIQGEGGTGKSLVIQTVTQAFAAKGQQGLLLKGAYTGIAASLIDGKTTHVLGAISLRGKELSEDGKKRLTEMLRNVQYLILDECSMLSRAFFATLSRHISIGKTGDIDADKPFGGINVVLCGDFHQFPPVAQKRTAPLYYETHAGLADTVDDALGREIYKQFNVVVRLTEQIRVSDPVWTAFLRHLRNGEVTEADVKMLQGLVLTDPSCPPTDFSSPEWEDVALVTPRHAVRTRWNDAALIQHCEKTGVQLFICPAQDSIRGRPTSLEERYAIATKKSKRRGRQENAGLPDEVKLAVGMKVMVTVNVMTDLDVANGARGEIVDIILDPEETALSNVSGNNNRRVVKLTKPPAYILVRLDHTRAESLPGLPDGVIPIEPFTKSFEIRMEAIDASGRRSILKKTVKRKQFPITPAYAFTDYRSQGQTIPCVIVDIATPPGGQLTLFNIYVALSRSRGRQSIRILRDFDPRSLMQPIDEMLVAEDERLMNLDRNTKVWWEQMKNTMCEASRH